MFVQLAHAWVKVMSWYTELCLFLRYSNTGSSQCVLFRLLWTYANFKLWYNKLRVSALLSCNCFKKSSLYSFFNMPVAGSCLLLFLKYVFSHHSAFQLLKLPMVKCQCMFTLLTCLDNWTISCSHRPQQNLGCDEEEYENTVLHYLVDSRQTSLIAWEKLSTIVVYFMVSYKFTNS